MKRPLKFPLKFEKGIREITRKRTTKEALKAFKDFMTDAMICYTELRNGCLISLTIFSFVSLASLGPRIAIGTPDH
jgi:hypothetical protein